MKSVVKFLSVLYAFEAFLLCLLCCIAVVKGIVISWEGHTLMECLEYSFGIICIPLGLLLFHFFFTAFFGPILRLLSTICVLPFLIVITAFVIIPASGHIPPKPFGSLSEIERIDVLKKDVQDTWKKSQYFPNGPEAEWVANWERWNHNPDGTRRKYESQIEEYEKEKADILEKKRIEKENSPVRLKILYWFFGG